VDPAALLATGFHARHGLADSTGFTAHERRTRSRLTPAMRSCLRAYPCGLAGRIGRRGNSASDDLCGFAQGRITGWTRPAALGAACAPARW